MELLASGISRLVILVLIHRVQAQRMPAPNQVKQLRQLPGFAPYSHAYFPGMHARGAYNGGLDLWLYGRDQQIVSRLPIFPLPGIGAG